MWLYRAFSGIVNITTPLYAVHDPHQAAGAPQNVQMTFASVLSFNLPHQWHILDLLQTYFG